MDNEAFVFWALVFGGVLTFTTAVVATGVFLLKSSASRWMSTGRVHYVGQGSFRNGPTVSEKRVQRRRWLVLAGCITNVMWAAITALVLAPLGALGMYVSVDQSSANDTAFWYAIGAAAVDAWPMAIAIAISFV